MIWIRFETVEHFEEDTSQRRTKNNNNKYKMSSDMRSVSDLKILFQQCNNYYYVFKSTG